MLLIILNVLLIIYLILSMKRIINDLKKVFKEREVNLIIHGALLGVIASTTVNIFSKTIVMILDSIGG